MAKCEEEFNPWPSFVDIFSSVILVMLLFLLVTLVNLGYYAQFKFKISYTGSIATDDLILNSNPQPVVEKVLKTKKEVQEVVDKLQEKIEVLEKTLQNTKNLESPGIDYAEQMDDNKESKQKSIETDEYMIVTFKDNEIFVDDAIIKKIKAFTKNIKEKIGEHKIYISAVDPKNQVSATIAKQISLGRTISARNLIRKFGYEKKDVKVDLLSKIDLKEKFDDKNGYIVIKVKK
ncbi:hypothetical protein CRU99_05890 [Malaciobacter mytili]|uniref:Uncharacterized protein n=1 Tax=Malaciobacter mytili LMG 24559 TaxID=1032238 RepID=A0AAX2AH80_9BACT|nr:hypothetical protein [Malaciobacter mytili]AXH15247.1 hypothetical protein AMYT_1673 [Malaciobacter mytili LMG 24559]RXI44065.1 hypothetical protein CRU99_05890 [Malaciobacter mytili]RXK15561.1 hypothetical protein CP985_07870 [Malaciobacter mytili LMG 24559]